MRSKVIAVIGALAIAFLLATNPVVTNAAAKIGSNGIKNNAIKSKHIKNNNVKSADIKNGGVKAVDLAADAVPSQIDSVTRLPNTGIVVPGGTRSFARTPATVAVDDANDLIVIDSVLELDPNAVGDTIDLATCYRVAGSGATPSVLDPANLFDQNADHTAEIVYAVFGSGSLAAGTYEVGPCTSVFSGTWSTHSVEGLVTVFDGDAAGPFGKLGTGAKPEPRS